MEEGKAWCTSGATITWCEGRWAWRLGRWTRAARGCLVHHAEEFRLYKQQVVADFLKSASNSLTFVFLLEKLIHCTWNKIQKIKWHTIRYVSSLLSSLRDPPRGLFPGANTFTISWVSFLRNCINIQANANNVFFFFINGILVIYCCRENYSQTQWLTHFLSLFLWVTGIWEQLRWVVLAQGLSWSCTQDLSEDWGQLKLDLGWRRPQNEWSEREKEEDTLRIPLFW